MIAAPAATPTMSATCCRIGEARTSCPVLRSCRLSLEMVAQAKTPEGKKQLVASSLALTDAEAKKFWPVYDAYQRKLEANNRRYSLAVEDAVMTSKPISDAYAKALAKELTEIEDAEARARKSLYSGAVKALPGRKAVRYLQIETKLQDGYRYEIATTLPLIK